LWQERLKGWRCSVYLWILRFAQDDGKNKDRKKAADSSAALRNDKQKNSHNKKQTQDAGVLPFDKLRVRMTIVRGDPL
jgi:hypothetical protein